MHRVPSAHRPPAPRRTPTFLALFALTALTMAAPVATAAPLAGQSVLDRPPNMTGTWAGRSGTVYFNFIHRFTATDPPARKVLNYPTFLLGAGLPGGVFVGTAYGSNSELVSGIPNEWEFFGRWGALDQTGGGPLDLTLQGGYNHAAESVDGELALARTFADRLRLMAAARAFSDAFAEGESRGAWAVGGSYAVSDHVALAGDYARLFDLEEADGDAAWSAGLQLAIPFTPHTLSLQASNATTTTLQGSSVGVGETRWGFEFTVPLTLSRYFGDGGGGGADAPAPADPDAPDPDAEVGMNNQLDFTPDTVRIEVGETIRWTNDSDLVHTVTADPERAVDASNVWLPEGASTFDSGDIAPGETFEYTFTVAGEYGYVCVPHEMAGMVGVVIVGEPGS